MKYQLRWLTLVLAFALSIAGSMGCATILATESGTNYKYTPKLLLSDEIIAIGQPDATLASKLKQPEAIAFIGRKNTYMLFKGGKELQDISRLELDGKRMNIDSSRSRKLYLKDKMVWGELVLTYRLNKDDTTNDQARLEKAGFTLISSPRNKVYRKRLHIEGITYPALNLPESQLDKLTTHRKISLYDPHNVEPSFDASKVVLVPLAIAVDVLLTPVYLFAGVVLLTAAATN